MQQIIALAVDSVIYAPLFIAQELFPELQLQFGVIKMSDIEPRDNPADQTLRVARAFDAAFSNRKCPPVLALCDPMHALVFNAIHATDRLNAKLLGTLLRGPACWLFNHANSDSELIKRINRGALKKICTHPRGMTADTLTRWLLNTNGLASRLEALISNENQPWDVLQLFGSDATGTSDYVAVSVELLQMLQLQSRVGNLSDHKLRYNFPDPETLKTQEGTYLMTTLVTTTTERQRCGKQIEQILAGVNNVFELMRNPSGRTSCASALYRHYKHRPFRTQLPRECTTLTPLQPLSPGYEQALWDAYDLELSSDRYPLTVRDQSLVSDLQFTWKIYRSVQAAIFDAIEQRYKKTLDDFEAKLASLPDESLQIPHDILTDLSERYIVLLNAFRELSDVTSQRREPRKEATALADWIANLNGFLPMHKYEIIPGYVFFDDSVRKKLRLKLQELFSHMASPTGAYVGGIIGASGSGKDGLVIALRNYLIKQQKICDDVIYISAGGCSTPQDLESKIKKGFGKLDVSSVATNCRVLVIINEFDKPPHRIYESLLVPTDLKQGDSECPFNAKIKNRDVVWLFVGAYRDQGEALRTLNVSPGKDIASRIGEKWFEIPAIKRHSSLHSDAALQEKLVLEIAIRFVAMAGATKYAKPEKVEAALLFSLLGKDFSDARQIEWTLDGIMKRIGSDRILRTHDLWNDEDWRDFYDTYREFLVKLSAEPIIIHWSL